MIIFIVVIVVGAININANGLNKVMANTYSQYKQNIETVISENDVLSSIVKMYSEDFTLNVTFDNGTLNVIKKGEEFVAILDTEEESVNKNIEIDATIKKNKINGTIVYTVDNEKLYNYNFSLFQKRHSIVIKLFQDNKSDGYTISLNNRIFKFEDGKFKFTDKDIKKIKRLIEDYKDIYIDSVVEVNESKEDGYDYEYVLEIPNSKIREFYTDIFEYRAEKFIKSQDIKIKHGDEVIKNTSFVTKGQEFTMRSLFMLNHIASFFERDNTDITIKTQDGKIKSSVQQIKTVMEDITDEFYIKSFNNTDDYINSTCTTAYIGGDSNSNSEIDRIRWIEDNKINVRYIDRLNNEYDYTVTHDLTNGEIKTVDNLTGETEVNAEKSYEYKTDDDNNISIIIL